MKAKRIGTEFVCHADLPRMSASVARYSVSSPRLPARRSGTGLEDPRKTTGLPPFAQNPESFAWRCDRFQQIDPDQPVRRCEVRQISLLDQPFRHLEVLLLEGEAGGQQGAASGQASGNLAQKGASARSRTLRQSPRRSGQ